MAKKILSAKEIPAWYLIDNVDERVAAYNLLERSRRAWKKAYPIDQYAFSISKNRKVLHDDAFQVGATPSQVRLVAKNDANTVYHWQIGKMGVLDYSTRTGACTTGYSKKTADYSAETFGPLKKI